MSMINDCYKYAAAINAKGEPFLVEPLLGIVAFTA
jgi:hypothetical protein